MVGEPLAGSRSPRPRPASPETRPRRGRNAIPADPAFYDLTALIRSGDRPRLEPFLVAGSHLPGPRANLALARRFGVEAATLPIVDLIALVSPWLDVTLDEAPIDTPAEFLPACAAVALGLGVTREGPHPSSLEPLLRQAAHDPRWRTREGLVLGLQTAGEHDPKTLLTLCDHWVACRDAYLMRAVIASFAHPPILRRPGVAAIALSHARTAVDLLQSQPAVRRSTEGSAILTEALGSSLSAFVLAAPGPGLRLLDDLLAGGDRATRRIVNTTLGDPSFAKVHPTQVTHLKGWIYEMDDWQRG